MCAIVQSLWINIFLSILSLWINILLSIFLHQGALQVSRNLFIAAFPPIFPRISRSHLEKCLHMLSGSVFLEDRICAFPHHVIYCFHYVQHFLKWKGTRVRLHTRWRSASRCIRRLCSVHVFLKFFLRCLLVCQKPTAPTQWNQNVTIDCEISVLQWSRFPCISLGWERNSLI